MLQTHIIKKLSNTFRPVIYSEFNISKEEHLDIKFTKIEPSQQNSTFKNIMKKMYVEI